MRRRRPWILAAAGAVAVIWAGAVVVLLLGARTDLESARGAAEQGAEALRGGDVEAAGRWLATAEEHFAAAAERLGSPVVAPAGVLPVARPNLAAVRALAEAGAVTARAGRTVTDAVTTLPGGLAALTPAEGALPVEALETIGPSVTAARSLLSSAQVIVDDAPSEGLIDRVAEGRETFVARLDEAEETLASAEPLVRALPAFLGAEGPRRYFFGAAQPSELRGSTGFIGAYSILTLDHGRFTFSGFAPIQDLPVVPPGIVEPPHPDFEARYAGFGGTGFWQNLNVSPDFPTTGQALERLWEHTFGERLDGTISADPFALAALLELSGPTEVPGVGTVDASTVVPFVSNEAYGVLTDPEERKRLLGDVAAAALAGFLDRGLDGADGQRPLDALRVLGSAASEGHIVVHAADPAIQSTFEAAGIAGELLDPPGGYFAAFVNGASGTKIDYYLDRELDYRTVLEADGASSAQATVRLRNDAPASGQPNYVIGPNTDRAVAGENQLYLNAYLASSAVLEGVTIDGRPGRGQVETELGHPVVETFEELPSGADRELTYDIALSDAWIPEGDGGRYRLTVQEQVTIRPTRVSLEVRVPPGARVVAADEPWTVDGGVVRYEGELRGTFSAEVLFAWARQD